MITKAIVEEILSPYQVKVRVPTLDRAASTVLATDTDSLNIATICSLPNCYINVQVGDIVFVGFEDNTYYKAVILGHLSRKAMCESYADITLGNLVVNATANLPSETHIGSVTPSDLTNIISTKENVQKQIDDLRDKIDTIFELLKGGAS